MRIANRLVLSLLSVCSLLACGPSLESSQRGIDKHHADLRARAAFDLKCPEKALEVTPLKSYKNAFHPELEYAVSAGVDGCGNRGTYIYDSNRGLWILNSTSDTQHRPSEK